jgi:type IV pilus assembly protein PilA
MPTWLIVLLSVGIGGVFIVGILAVLAIYGVRKYIGNAKQAEARNALGQIAKDAATAYERESLTTGTPDGLCASASRSVPSSAAMIKGMKYQSAPSDWEVDASKPHAGFACLGFSMDMPQYYMYSYRAHGATKPGDDFTATANGDLNGDGVISTLWISGKVAPGGVLSIEPRLGENNPQE